MPLTGETRSKQASETWLTDEMVALTRLHKATARMWCVNSLEEGLAEILVAAIELFDADMGQIQLYDAERQILVIAAQRGFDQEYLNRFAKIPIESDPLACRALQLRQRILIEDLQNEQESVDVFQLAHLGDFDSVQATPIYGREGRLLGLLSTHFRRQHRFRNADLWRMDLYVNQAAEFIQHWQTKRLALENEKRLQLFIDSAPTSIAMFDRELRYVVASRRWMNGYNLNPAVIGRSLFDLVPNLDETLKALKERCLSGETVSIEIQGIPQGERANRIVKWNCGPWLVSNGVIGGITIAEEEITEFRETERALKWRVECDRLLSDAASRLLQSSDPRGLVEELCRNVMNLFGFDLFLSFLADPQTGKLRLDAYSGISEDEAFKVEWLNYAHTLCGSVIRDRRPIVGGELLKADDHNLNLLEPWGIRAYCCYPLQVQGAIIGTMSFGARDRNQFTTDEVHVIKAITDMMAIAMNRVQAEKDLRQSERQLQVFVENAPAAIAMFDQQMRYLAASRRWIDENRLPEHVLGQSHYDLVPQLSEQWKDNYRRGLAGEKLSSPGESLIHPDGRLQWLKWEVQPWYHFEGVPGGIIVTTEDITQLKQAERLLKRLNLSLEKEVIERTSELRNREERLQAILNAAVDAIVTYDSQGTIQSVNPATEKLFGYTADRLIGQDVRMLAFDGEQCDWIRRQSDSPQIAIADMNGSGRELVVRRRDGSTFTAELSISEIPDLELFIGIFRDVSQRKELERDVVEATSVEQLRIGQDMHDSVGQELTALNLLAQTLQEDPSNGLPLIDRIVDGLRRCRQQMRMVLRGLVPVAIDNMGLMSALSDLAERAKKDGDINCSFECRQPVAIADNLAATQLYLIAQEAVHNALKHANAKNIHVNLESNEKLTLSVEDDGCGIPKPKSDPASLGGLGLRIMRNRAAIIGANLSIERKSPTGTIVACTLFKTL